MELQGKIVLVTGASSGIGKAIAIAFAQKRAQVLVHYGRNKVGAQETLREVEKFSKRATLPSRPYGSWGNKIAV